MLWYLGFNEQIRGLRVWLQAAAFELARAISHFFSQGNFLFVGQRLRIVMHLTRSFEGNWQHAERPAEVISPKLIGIWMLSAHAMSFTHLLLNKDTSANRKCVNNFRFQLMHFHARILFLSWYTLIYRIIGDFWCKLNTKMFCLLAHWGTADICRVLYLNSSNSLHN